MNTIEFIKHHIQNVFVTCGDSKVAKTVSQVMSLIVLRGGFNIWPELLKFLADNLRTFLNVTT